MNPQTLHLKQQLHPSLPLWEISFYTAGWIFGVGYSIFNVYKASRKYYRQLAIHDLEPGWFGGQSQWRKDMSDGEWFVFSAQLGQMLPWIALHAFGSQYFKRSGNKELLGLFNVLLSSIYVSKFVGLGGFAYLAVQPLLLWCAHLLRSPTFLWVCALSFITFSPNWPHADFKEWLLGGDADPSSSAERLGGDSDPSSSAASRDRRWILSVTTCWINARCISFTLDRLWYDAGRSGSSMQDLINLFSYCFYIPLCFGGPIINYKEFETGMRSDYQPWTSDRILRSLSLIARYSFWFIFNNLVLHFFYFDALQMNESLLPKVDLWTLCGIGYSMGQFFHMKYLVFYGMPIVFLEADAIQAPSPPKCIGRIHLYSDMWRYFDNGLYQFIHKYIYAPLLNSGVALWLGGQCGSSSGVARRLFSSLICFSFIFVWHGTYDHVFIWSALNFFGVTAEGFARAIGRHPAYQQVEKRLLSGQGKRRFYAFISAPLFMLSILSNFYFFMGTQTGHHFMYRCYTSWPVGTPVILFFMYCACHTSMEVKNWEVRHKILDLESRHFE